MWFMLCVGTVDHLAQHLIVKVLQFLAIVDIEQKLLCALVGIELVQITIGVHSVTCSLFAQIIGVSAHNHLRMLEFVLEELF